MKVAFIDIDHSISNAYWRDGMIGTGTWDDYHEASAKDQPIKETIELINSLHKDSWTIIGVTGRPERFRQLSNLWLVENYVMIDKLIMRADDDYNPSADYKIAAVKEEMLTLPKDAIVVAFDDRDNIVAAYRAAHILVLQIHSGGSNEKA